jgi:hypothetical protein
VGLESLFHNMVFDEKQDQKMKVHRETFNALKS